MWKEGCIHSIVLPAPRKAPSLSGFPGFLEAGSGGARELATLWQHHFLSLWISDRKSEWELFLYEVTLIPLCPICDCSCKGTLLGTFKG